MLTFAQRLRMKESLLLATALDTAFHVVAKVRKSMPGSDPARHDVHVLRDVVYGPTSDVGHKLDIYVPGRSPKPLPVVMYVHGGGFRMLSKETHFGMAMAYARRGYLVFNINYRYGFQHPFPTPLEDACEAFLWVHRHAAEYGGDATRIALSGESAGGNLVTALSLLTVTAREEPLFARVYDANIPLRAVATAYPFCDVTDSARLWENGRLHRMAKRISFDATASYLGSAVFDLERAPYLASPLVWLERPDFRPSRPLPPFCLSAGTRDPLLAHSKRLKAALERHGGSADLFIAPGEIHGFDALTWRPQARLKWQHTHRFLAHHMAKDAG
jgi:acetyl esterase